MLTPKNKLLKKCFDCGLEAYTDEELELFTTDKRRKFGKRNLCKKCEYERRKILNKKNREKFLSQHRSAHFLRKYGITEQERINLVNKIGFCEICGAPLSPKGHGAHIDHSHRIKDKNIRGVLCNKCNTGLGKFNEDVGLLNEAILYLIKREHNLPDSFARLFSIKSILDDLWHAIDTDSLNKTSDFYKELKKVKDKYPKGENG